jgi:hypothetical protein
LPKDREEAAMESSASSCVSREDRHASCIPSWRSPDVGFGKIDLIKETEDLSHEVRKMLFGMLDSLNPAKAARRNYEL